MNPSNTYLTARCRVCDRVYTTSGDRKLLNQMNQNGTIDALTQSLLKGKMLRFRIVDRDFIVDVLEK